MKSIATICIFFMMLHSLTAQHITGTTKMHNLLYWDVPNTIYFKDIDLEKYKVSISNGEILNSKKSVLTVLIDSEYKTTITLQRKNFVKELNYRVIPFPNPKITVKTDGAGDLNNMTIEEFVTLKSAYASLENFSVNCALVLKGCDVIQVSTDGKKRAMKIYDTGNYLKQLTKRAKKGEVYIFTNIKVKIMQTERIVNATGFTLYLK